MPYHPQRPDLQPVNAVYRTVMRDTIITVLAELGVQDLDSDALIKALRTSDEKAGLALDILKHRAD